VVRPPTWVQGSGGAGGQPSSKPGGAGAGSPTRPTAAPAVSPTCPTAALTARRDLRTLVPRATAMSSRRCCVLRPGNVFACWQFHRRWRRGGPRAASVSKRVSIPPRAWWPTPTATSTLQSNGGRLAMITPQGNARTLALQPTPGFRALAPDGSLYSAVGLQLLQPAYPAAVASGRDGGAVELHGATGGNPRGIRCRDDLCGQGGRARTAWAAPGPSITQRTRLRRRGRPVRSSAR
jgi:hypothetical protein